MATAEELRPRVANPPAQPFLEPENARMFGSTRSVTTAALAGLEHVDRQSTGVPFSLRRFVRPTEASGGVLFMPYAAGQIASLRSLIATWLRLAIFEAMNGPEGDQRLWSVIDELDALGAIDGLKDALARVRKVRRPLRVGISVHRPSECPVWTGRCTNDHRELREYVDPPMLGQ